MPRSTAPAASAGSKRALEGCAEDFPDEVPPPRGSVCPPPGVIPELPIAPFDGEVSGVGLLIA